MFLQYAYFSIYNNKNFINGTIFSKYIIELMFCSIHAQTEYAQTFVRFWIFLELHKWIV